MVWGYKCFEKGLINRYGFQFEAGKVYHADDTIKFGENGFHFCAYLEDTLRYFDGMDKDVDIALVHGYGNIYEYNDEYNGYYDMYSSEYIEIIKVLTRSEIINYVMQLNDARVKRFVSLYKLTDEEIDLFKEKFQNSEIVINAICYYQEKNYGIYKLLYQKKLNIHKKC